MSQFKKFSVRHYLSIINARLHGQKMAFCPIHGDGKNPSFTIDQDDEHWHCYGSCSTGGDVFDLYMQYTKTDKFMDAVAAVYELFGEDMPDLGREDKIKIVKKRNKQKVLSEFMEAHKELPREAELYLVSRGYSPEFIKKWPFAHIEQKSRYKVTPEAIDMGLVYESGRICMADVPRILFPVVSGGKVIFFQARIYRDEDISPPEPADGTKQKRPARKFWGMKGTPPLFGDLKGPVVYVFEGITDWTMAIQEGYNAVGFPGNGLQPKDIAITVPNSVKEIILITDNDDAGEKYLETWGTYFLQYCDVSLKRITAGTDYCEYRPDLRVAESISIINYYKSFLPDQWTKYMETIFKLLATLRTRSRTLFDVEFSGIKKSIPGLTIGSLRQEFGSWQAQNSISGECLYEGKSYIMPEGHVLTQNGVINANGKFTSTPIVVSNVGVDESTGIHYAELMYTNGKTHVLVVPKLQIADENKFLMLADKGIGVYSGNKGELNTYLNQFVECNEYHKQLKIVSRLGWEGDRFVLPDRVIVKEIQGDEDDQEKEVACMVESWGPETFRATGSLEAWVNAWKEFHTIDHTVPVFLLYAAFAGLILKRIGDANQSIMIHLTNDSSTGKTTSIKAALSAIGFSQKGPGSLVLQHTDSEAAIFRLISQLVNIPFGIDEGSSTDREMSPLIYVISEGQRPRRADGSSSTSVVAASGWQTTVFSSGEPSITDDSTLSGAVTRIIQIDSPPIAQDSKVFVDTMEAAFTRNYGHALEPFLNTFFETQITDIEYFTDDYDLLSLQGPQGRYMKQFQYIYIAAVIAERTFNFGFDPKKIINRVLRETIDQVKEGTCLAKRWLRYMYDVAQSPDPPFTLCTKVTTGNKSKIYVNNDRMNFRKPTIGWLIYDEQYECTDLAITRKEFDGTCLDLFGKKVSKVVLQKLASKSRLSWQGNDGSYRRAITIASGYYSGGSSNAESLPYSSPELDDDIDLPATHNRPNVIYFPDFFKDEDVYR